MTCTNAASAVRNTWGVSRRREQAERRPVSSKGRGIHAPHVVRRHPGGYVILPRSAAIRAAVPSGIRRGLVSLELGPLAGELLRGRGGIPPRVSAGSSAQARMREARRGGQDGRPAADAQRAPGPSPGAKVLRVE